MKRDVMEYKRDARCIVLRDKATGNELDIYEGPDGERSVEFYRSAGYSIDRAVAPRPALRRRYADDLTLRQAKAYADKLFGRWEGEDKDGYPVFRASDDRFESMRNITDKDALKSWTGNIAREPHTGRYVGTGQVMLDSQHERVQHSMLLSKLRAPDPARIVETTTDGKTVTESTGVDASSCESLFEQFGKYADGSPVSAEVLGWVEGPMCRVAHLLLADRTVAHCNANYLALAMRAVRPGGVLVSVSTTNGVRAPTFALCNEDGELMALLAGLAGPLDWLDCTNDPAEAAARRAFPL